jgi:hypothetical protein
MIPNHAASIMYSSTGSIECSAALLVQELTVRLQPHSQGDRHAYFPRKVIHFPI